LRADVCAGAASHQVPATLCLFITCSCRQLLLQLSCLVSAQRIQQLLQRPHRLLLPWLRLSVTAAAAAAVAS
jgi:hypothetical protein